MSICIPSENCGINDNYVSVERGITFVTSDTDSCPISEDDFISGTEGSNCESNNYLCNIDLICALDIDDGTGNNPQSICIPQENCGVNGNYDSS